MVATREVKVGGKHYLQVVEYKKTHDGRTKTEVLKSFGENSLENKMRAEQFSASYDRLKELTIQQREQNSSADILSAGLTIFGIILGAAVVGAVIDEFTGGESTE